MKKLILITLIAFSFLGFSSCKDNVSNTDLLIQAVDTADIETINPYLTTDHRGLPVLCWTAKGVNDSIYRLKYAFFEEDNKRFGEPVTVPTSAGLSTSAESAGKIAFKSDGTVVAAFGQKIENQRNPFASAVFYSVSTDDGKNWTEKKAIHSDTILNNSHAFFDLACLQDGEIAAIWLDSRLSDGNGSALLFSKTTAANSFNEETWIDKNTCECCRTDIVVEDDGKIHVAYRALRNSPENFSSQIRDMYYSSSADGGRSFSVPVALNNDNWEVNGCPHTGPDLTVVDKQVHAAWFTGKNPGLYYAVSDKNAGFNAPVMVSATGKHPQIVGMTNQVGVLYEQAERSEGASTEEHAKMDHTGMNHANHLSMKDHLSIRGSAIKLDIYKNGEKKKEIEVCDASKKNRHPVVISWKKSVLIAWVQENGDNEGVKYTVLPNKML